MLFVYNFYVEPSVWMKQTTSFNLIRTTFCPFIYHLRAYFAHFSIALKSTATVLASIISVIERYAAWAASSYIALIKIFMTRMCKMKQKW